MDEFQIENNVLKKYRGTSAEVVIPEGVKAIGEYAFCYSPMRRVVLPQSVETIASNAFVRCNRLKEIEAHGTLKEIARDAFFKCPLLKGTLMIGAYLVKHERVTEEVIVPDEVRIIGEEAFCAIPMSSLTLPEGLQKIGKNAFQWCRAIEEITIPASVKEVEAGAFRECRSLKKVTILSGDVQFGKNVFDISPVQEVIAPWLSVSDLPRELKKLYLKDFLNRLARGEEIDERVQKANQKYVTMQRKRLYATTNEALFTYMLQNGIVPIEDIDGLITKFNEENHLARVAALIDYRDKRFTEAEKERQFNKLFEVHEQPTVADLKRIWTTQKKEDGTYRITGYKGPELDIVVPAAIGRIKVTEIGKSRAAKYSTGCITNVRSVVVSEGIEIIGIAAFQKCSALTKVELPETVTKIARDAFKSCSKLKNLQIPHSVEEIGDNAFFNCRSLSEVTLSKQIRSIGYKAFASCRKIKKVTVLGSVAALGWGAFINCSALESVSFAEGLEKIGGTAFEGCWSLREVQLPTTLKEIGLGAFGDCRALQQFTLPKGVKVIDTVAFQECAALKKINIPASVQKIGDSAFTKCKSLEVIVLPQGLSTMGTTVFDNYATLTILCKPKKKPVGWLHNWNGGAKVIWGYTGD